MLDASLDAARRTQTPPNGQAQRTWAAVLPIVGSPWTPVKLTLASAANSVWMPVAVVGAIAIGIGRRNEAPEASTTQPPADSGSVLAASSADGPPDHNAEATAPAAPQAAEIDAAPVGPDAATDPAAAPDSAGTRSAASAAPRAARTPAAASSPTPDMLALEVELLEEARSSLGRGDPDRALSLLRDLDARVAGGQLLDARKAARVRALCGLGRASEAEREAAALHREHPSSNVALGTPRKCDAS